MNRTTPLLITALCVALGSTPHALAIPPLLPIAAVYIVATNIGPAIRNKLTEKSSTETLKSNDSCNDETSKESEAIIKQMLESFAKNKQEENEKILSMFNNAYKKTWREHSDTNKDYVIRIESSELDPMTLIAAINLTYKPSKDAEPILLERKKYPLPQPENQTVKEYRKKLEYTFWKYEEETMKKIDVYLKAGNDPVSLYLPHNNSQPQLIE